MPADFKDPKSDLLLWMGKMCHLSRVVVLFLAVLFVVSPASILAQLKNQKEMEARAMRIVLDAHDNAHGISRSPRSSPLLLLITHFPVSPIGAYGVEEYEDGTVSSYRYFYGWARQGGADTPPPSRTKLLSLISKLPEGDFAGPNVDKVIVSYYGSAKPWTRIYDRGRLPESVHELFDYYGLTVIPRVPRQKESLWYEGHESGVTSINWARVLVSSGLDGTIKRWNGDSGQLIDVAVRAKDEQPITMACDSGNHWLAYYTGHVNQVDVIDTGVINGNFKRLGGVILDHHPTAMMFLGEENLLLTASKKDTEIWNWRSGRRIRSFPASGAVVAADERGGFAWSGRDGVYLYRSPNAQQRRNAVRMETDGVAFPELVSAPKVGIIGYQAEPKKMKFFDVAEPTKWITIRPYPWPPTCTAISPGGRYFAVRGMGFGAQMFLYDVRTGKPICEFTGDRTALKNTEFDCLAFSPDETQIAANSGGQILIWRIPEQNAE